MQSEIYNTGLFPFLAVLGGIFDTLYAGRTFALHGMMQSIRADGRYFTNPARIDFSHLISSPFCSKISSNPIRLENVHSFIRETVLTMANGIRYQSVDLGGQR